MPAATHSFHWIADPRFRSAIADALARERRALLEYGGELLEHAPYARRDAESAALRTPSLRNPPLEGEG